MGFSAKQVFGQMSFGQTRLAQIFMGPENLKSGHSRSNFARDHFL
jgi:hypothetical protein